MVIGKCRLLVIVALIVTVAAVVGVALEDAVPAEHKGINNRRDHAVANKNKQNLQENYNYYYYENQDNGPVRSPNVEVIIGTRTLRSRDD